jgi:hypothetical protein
LCLANYTLKFSKKGSRLLNGIWGRERKESEFMHLLSAIICIKWSCKGGSKFESSGL